MARVAWTFASYSFPINPFEDTGWTYEHVESEQVPIQATKSSIQVGGRKSPRRKVSGYIWGAISAGFYDQLESWRKNNTVGTLTDHLGEAKTARLVRFEPKLLEDYQEWAAGRQTFRYDAEWVEV